MHHVLRKSSKIHPSATALPVSSSRSPALAPEGPGLNLIKVRDDSHLSAVAAKLVHPLGRWSDGAAAGLYVSSSGHAHSTYSWQYSGGHWRDLGPGGIKGRKTLMTRLGPLSLKRTSF